MHTTASVLSAAMLLAALAVAGCSIECPAGPPIAADDHAITRRGKPVALALTANDRACGAAALDVDSLDLDPSTPGTQLSIITGDGGYMLDGPGDVRFVPADGFSGDAAIPYTIADSEGQVSAPARILVTVEAP